MARILICDDAVFMRMTIKDILEKAGHEIVGEVDNGNDAVSVYQKTNPDLVTMDILMKTSGVSAVKKIKEIDPDARIIIVSVLNEQEGEVVEAVRSGALGIVTKPIKRESLIAEVKRVLAIEKKADAE